MPENLSGFYDCVGHNYRGTATIRKIGMTYYIQWQIGAELYLGIGLREGNILAFSWTSKAGQNGIVVYRIKSGRRMVGRFTDLQGKGTIQYETLNFIRPLQPDATNLPPLKTNGKKRRPD